MDGMHAGCGAQVVERQMRATFGVQFIHDALEPRWTVCLFSQRKTRCEAG
jgi:hypothetical protein